MELRNLEESMKNLFFEKMIAKRYPTDVEIAEIQKIFLPDEWLWLKAYISAGNLEGFGHFIGKQKIPENILQLLLGWILFLAWPAENKSCDNQQAKSFDLAIYLVKTKKMLAMSYYVICFAKQYGLVNKLRDKEFLNMPSLNVQNLNLSTSELDESDEENLILFIHSSMNRIGPICRNLGLGY